MIALTKEKREELTSYARERIAAHVIHGGCSDEEEIFKIALTALTAAPDHHVFKHPLGKLFYSLVDESCKGHDDVYPVYAAPPVPEIKLPDLLDIPDGLDLSSAIAAANWYEKEIKLLNGLGE